MLKIAICDDDNYICSKIEKDILDYEKTSNININIEIFYDGKELINFIKNNYDFDLIFLDIELITTTGIDVGLKIRNDFDDHISKIVFISSKTGYEEELFNVQPLNFLRKPVDKNKIIKCIELAQKILNLENRTFTYQIKHEIKKVDTKKILYFESSLKKIKIVMMDKVDYFYSTLDNIKEQLPKTFVSPHGSFLVNFNYIQHITKQDIYMINGDIIPASRRNIKNIQNLQINLAKELRNANL